TRELGLHHVGGAEQHFAHGTVDGDGLAFFHSPRTDAEHALLHVDADFARARHAGPTHAARDHGRVAGHAAARSDDRFRRVHAVNVFGARLLTHQDNGFAIGRERGGFIRIEHDSADSSAW